MSTALATIDAPAPAPEKLPARDWYTLLGISRQAFEKAAKNIGESAVVEGAVRRVYDFAALPAEYRAQLDALRVKQGAASFADLLDMRRVETRKWKPPKAWAEYGAGTRLRAEQWHAALAVWYRALANARTKVEANRLARCEYERITGRRVSDKQVYRKAKLIDERGGEFAPITAYCDNKEKPHPAQRLAVPEDFAAALRSKACEPGVLLFSAAVRYFEIRWKCGEEVPGLGRAREAGEPFPYTVRQLRKLAPSRVARVIGGRGKAAAKFDGLLAAPAVAARELRLRERIVLDDKRLDLVALDDETGRPVSLVLYIAMDETTRQVLGYLLREDGAVRQTDVEGLVTFILRVCGFAGHSAGYATHLIFERGTVAISEERKRLIEALFPGEIVIHRTSMIGGTNFAGDFHQVATGNFFGKGKLESFMATLDRYLAHVPGQRGNVYRNQPAMLGDLTLTPERLAEARQLKGTMIEEAVLCAQMARAVAWVDDGKAALPGAFQAAQASGVRAPLLYVSQVHTALQAMIAHYNCERGHRRGETTGDFEDIRLVDNGALRAVSESSNDKAARLEAQLAMRGRSLQRIAAADAAVLLHKVRRVTVRARDGAKAIVAGVARQYWCADSLACAAAARNAGGEKEYLALFNPEDPSELLLLDNPPAHVAPTATELPAGMQPVFLEALPLYVAPEITDAGGMAARAREVARDHGRAAHELNRTLVPFAAEHTERRERNLEIAEPLRASVVAVANRNLPEREATATGESVEKRTPSRLEAQKDARLEAALAALRSEGGSPF